MGRCGQHAAAFHSEVHSGRRRGCGKWEFQCDVKGKNIAYNKTGQKTGISCSEAVFYFGLKVI